MKDVIWRLEKQTETITEIKKSKFISISYIVKNIVDVNNVLDSLRKKYSDATHICYAYNLMNGEMKYEDDGEPQGTAGKPILDCITKKNLSNCMVVVVRYFGGIKLGAGGLVRAYSNSASSAISGSGIIKSERYSHIKIFSDIYQNKYISKIKQDTNFKELSTIYQGDSVIIDTYVQLSFMEKLQEYVNNKFDKETKIEILEEVYM